MTQITHGSWRIRCADSRIATRHLNASADRHADGLPSATYLTMPRGPDIVTTAIESGGRDGSYRRNSTS